MKSFGSPQKSPTAPSIARNVLSIDENDYEKRINDDDDDDAASFVSDNFDEEEENPIPSRTKTMSKDAKKKKILMLLDELRDLIDEM